jgi:MinD superfamily P-loop ATPase
LFGGRHNAGSGFRTAGHGTDAFRAVRREQGIPVLLEIPEDRSIAEAYSRGGRIVDSMPGYRYRFARLYERLMDREVGEKP